MGPGVLRPRSHEVHERSERARAQPEVRCRGRAAGDEAIAAASRPEPGCISYRLYEDTEAENEFVFVEEWDSDEALHRHFATPHIAAFMQAVRATVVAPPDVKFHTIASSMDLADVTTG